MEGGLLLEVGLNWFILMQLILFFSSTGACIYEVSPDGAKCSKDIVPKMTFCYERKCCRFSCLNYKCAPFLQTSYKIRNSVCLLNVLILRARQRYRHMSSAECVGCIEV